MDWRDPSGVFHLICSTKHCRQCWMYKQSCFTSSRMDKQSCFTNPRIGSSSALVFCLGLGLRYESASVPDKFLPWTKDIITAFLPSVLSLLVVVSHCGFNKLDGKTTTKLVLIIALKQLSNGISVTIPSLSLQGIWTGKFDSFYTNMLFVS